MEHSKGEVRRRKILAFIKLRGKASIQEIVQAAESSESTIRRDLEWMEKSNLIIRTIGGAIPVDSPHGQASSELPFAEKRFVNQQGKAKIAELAVSLVRDGDVVCLTGGSTTFMIAKLLKTFSNLTVVTNAVNIAAELAEAEGVQVVVTGGVMRPKSYELIGPLAEQVIDKLNITKMFLGVDGLSAEHGITMYSELETHICQLLIARSAEVYAVCDDSKLEKLALFTLGPLGATNGIITDIKPSASFEQACEKQHVSIFVADNG